ncbi:lectin c-type domain-containing protein [Ditylenchus destructor]|nr:lectin c-type domain-containing protein [Ditylenchus destructor]
MNLLILLILAAASFGCAQAKYERLANAVGTPCNQNLTSANLDILIFFDLTGSTETKNLLQSSLQRQLSTLSFGNNTDGTGSCVRLYYYWQYSLIGYNGTTNTPSLYTQKCLTYEELTIALSNTTSITKSSSFTYLETNLRTAATIYDRWSSNRQKVAIFTLMKSTSITDQYYIRKASQSLKDAEIYVITISGTQDPLQNAMLSRAATSGQALSIYEDYFDDNLYTSFTNLLCNCPRNTTRLQVYNPVTNHYEAYGDCFKAIRKTEVSHFAEKQCESYGGSLVALTSPAKFNFIHEEVATPELGSTTEYIVGLRRSLKTKELVWYYYDKEEVPLGQYRKWVPENKNSTGYCGYVKIYGSYQYGLDMGAYNKRASYICQIKP